MALTKKDLVEALAQTRTDIVRDIRDEMDARFSASEQRLDKKLDTLRQEFGETISDQILPSIDTLHERFDNLSGRFDGLSGRVDGLSGRVDGLSGRVNDLSERVDGLSGRVDGLDKKFTTLDTKIDTVHKDLKRDLAGIRFHVGLAT